MRSPCAKLDFDVTPWLAFETNSSYSRTTYDRPQHNDWLFFHNVNRNNTLNVVRNPDGTYTSAGASLIGSLQEGGRQVVDEDMYQTTLAAEAEVVPEVLSVKADFSYRYNPTSGRAYDFPIRYRTGPDQPLAGDDPSWIEASSSEERYRVFNLYADLQKDWGVHDVQLVGGYNLERETYDYVQTSRRDLISTTLPSVELATGDLQSGASAHELAVQGLFYRTRYTLRDRYVLELNGRYDGSSRFPEDDRFAFFPSASAAWVASEEPFLQALSPALSLLKLRGSYGALGNQSVGGYYPYTPSMPSDRIAPVLDGEQPVAVYPPPLVSSSLTWERVTSLNAGVDVGLFGDRLTASLDLYRRATEDMITAGKTLPAVLGTGVPEENAADLKTEGWELALGWHDDLVVASSPFRYGIDVNLSDSRAWITRFDNPDGYLGDYYGGYEIGTIWGLETDGFFASDEEVASHADQAPVASYPGTRPVQAGDVRFRDLNGDGVIDDGAWTLEDHGDYRIIGNARPRLSYNLRTSASWKGLDLRVFLQGIGKRDYYPGPGDHYFWGIYAQPWSSLLQVNLDHWTPEDQEAYFPRPKAYVAETGKELGIPQTRYLQDASYLRLKNVTVGYTLPSRWTAPLGVSRLRLYLSGENLYEWTGLSENLDPEGLAYGGRVYPFQRTYTGGVNVTF